METIRSRTDIDAVLAAGKSTVVEIWAGVEGAVRDTLHENCEHYDEEIDSYGFVEEDSDGDRNWFDIRVVRIFGTA